MHLLGQSMGGWWVTAFALAHPDRTRTITLSNTVGGLWTQALADHFAAFVAAETRAAEAAAAILDGEGDKSRLGVHSALAPGFVERDPARAFLYQELNTFHTPPMGAIGRALAGGAVKHTALDALDIPILVITSTDDALFPAPLVIATAQRLARRHDRRDPRRRALHLLRAPGRVQRRAARLPRGLRYRDVIDGQRQMLQPSIASAPIAR